MEHKVVKRANELALFKSAWKRQETQLLVLHGRRRVGKTALMQRFANSCSHLDAATASRLPAQYDQVIGKLVVMINNPAPWLIPNK